METMARRGLLLLLVALGWGAGGVHAEAPSLSVAEVPAVGRGESVLSVPRFGRYAVTVKSSQGVALRAIDRMTGPQAWTGSAGKQDGRVDLLLDRGQVKLQTRGDARSTGTATLEAHAFRELSAPDPRRLVETRWVTGRLHDLEQASYWLVLDQARWVHLEAAGRALEDLRIWKDGAWLVATTPASASLEPLPGQAHRVRRIETRLDAGLYLVTAYGGVPEKWTADTEAYPFYLRWGVPSLGSAGRRRLVAGPLGRDLWRVPASASYFRLELPELRTASLKVGTWADSRVYGFHGTTARILKTALDPLVEVESGPGTGFKLVEVTVRPGQPYVLQHFAVGTGFSAQEGGPHWVSSIHSGDPRDSADATGVLTQRGRNWREPEQFVRAEVVELDPAHAWARRFNLLAEATLLIHTEELGAYRVHLSGAPAKVMVEPFLTNRPQGYKSPEFQDSGTTFELDPGYHVIRVKPERLGIVEMVVRPAAMADYRWNPRRAGRRGSREASLELEVERETTMALEIPRRGSYVLDAEGVAAVFHLGPLQATPGARAPAPSEFREAGTPWALDPGAALLTIQPTKPGRLKLALREERRRGGMIWDPRDSQQWEYQEPVRAGVKFRSVPLERGRGYTLHVGTQPGVKVGLVVRGLPMDLEDPLFVAQLPGEALTVPFRATEEGVLRAVAEDGSSLPLRVDGRGTSDSVRVARGLHEAAVRYEGTQPVQYTLAFTPASLDDEAPLPELDPARLDAIPEFPILSAASPQLLEMRRGQVRTFRLQVDEPGLYRVETTGLLATSGSMRTRTITSFASGDQNGAGRNFLVQRTLGQGDYQVDVSTRGQSQGHMGLRLARTRIGDGGALRVGRPARVTVPAGEAVVYRLELEEDHHFTVQVLGLESSPPYTLEDADGWPLVRPASTGEQQLELARGSYRLVLEPLPVETRRVVMVERLGAGEAPPVTGKGPHELGIDRYRNATWRADGPDVWTLEAPAAFDASVHLYAEHLTGRLLRGDTVVAEFASAPGQAAWAGRLEVGAHRLEVRPSRKDDRIEYAVQVRSRQLVAGGDREVRAPTTIEVAVGPAGAVEVASFGSQDVRAVLTDAAGEVVAEGDDRPDDWNFALGGRLAPGHYTLRVEPVGKSSASARVFLRAAPEREVAGLAVGRTATHSPGDGLLLIPLEGTAASSLLRLQADSEENVALALERQRGEAWVTLGEARGRRARLEVPLDAAARYRTRLGSLDRRGLPVTLTASALAPAQVEEKGAVTRARLTGVERLTLARPGLLELVRVGPSPRWSDSVDEPLRPARAGEALPVTAGQLWLVTDSGGALELHRKPAREVAGAPTKLVLAPGREALVDLEARHPGPLVAWVRSSLAQPGIRVAGASKGAAGAGMAVGPRAALALTLAAGDRGARIWDAGGSGRALPVELSLRSFPVAPPETMAPGVARAVLGEGARRVYRLPAGRKRLRLTLGVGQAAALATGERVESAHWWGGEAFDEGVVTEATDLHVFQLEGPGAPYQVTVLPLGKDWQQVLPYEVHSRVAGLLRLSVEETRITGKTLHARAPGDAEAVLITVDGAVHRGEDMPATPGVLLIPHAPGLVLAWTGDDLFASDYPGQIEPIEASREVRLNGPMAALLLTPPEAPMVARIDTDEPVVARIERSGEPPRVEVFEQGAGLALLLGQGLTEVRLRGVAHRPLAGRARVVLEAVERLREGAGDEVTIPPGATRTFLIEVTRPGSIGVGIRSVPGQVTCELRDAAGALIGRGVQQMPKVTPGLYALYLTAPAEGPPQRVRPAVVGVEPPDTGPPPAVIEDYLKKYRASTGGAQ